MPIRVLLVDDHNVVIEGLQMFLRLDPDLEVVGAAPDGVEAVRLAHDMKPDVILMDLLMPRMDGVTAIGLLRHALPDVGIIAMTSVLEDTAVAGAMEAGASSFLLKDTRAAELRRAIRAAASRPCTIPPQATADSLYEIQAPESPVK